MKNHEKTTGWMIVQVLLFTTMMAAAIVLMAVAQNVWGQTSTISVQFSHGGEDDLAGFHLFYRATGGEYALGYSIPLAEYIAPPAWMSLPISLPPGNYTFVATAFDNAGNESAYSNEAALTVPNLPPAACSEFKARLP